MKRAFALLIVALTCACATDPKAFVLLLPRACFAPLGCAGPCMPQRIDDAALDGERDAGP